MDDPEGYSNAQGALAAQHARRTGDLAGIFRRLRGGFALTRDELALLDDQERGKPRKTGRKDPDTAHETIVCVRWLSEAVGKTEATARSLVAEMIDVSPDAIKARIRRAKGLGQNFADLCFNAHMQAGVAPALLRHRDDAGHCLDCGWTKCRCQIAPRPAFEDTPQGRLPSVLMALWQAGG